MGQSGRSERSAAERDELLERAGSCRRHGATMMNDPARLALAMDDRDYLIAELSRAVGLGGRARLACATAERARTSVTRSLRYSVARLAEHHPTLGRHLSQALGTGTYCVYRPDPFVPIDWIV